MLLEIKNITKIYKGKVKANDDISLSIAEGEVFGLLGPNGAGTRAVG
jgi:ABC-2 type transport system ATP-binding protein